MQWRIGWPAFCYEITVTNCGTVPLTNLTVIDNLLGTLQGNYTQAHPITNFFSTRTNVLEPGAWVTAWFSMAFTNNATNTVTAQANADLAQSVTNVVNGSYIVTNATPVLASDSAVALVEQASISCSLSLNGGGDVLNLPEYVSQQPSVTVGITVANTGASPLSAVTIVAAPVPGLVCTPPSPFSLPVGGSTNITLCLDDVACPTNQIIDVSVTAVVDSDATHCGVFTLTGSPVTVCSSCIGTVECSPSPGGGCAVPNELSGAVVLDCAVGSTNLLGDMGLSGLTVSLYGSSGLSGASLATTTTDSNGNYSFTNLGGGTYTVVVTPQAGYAETYPLGSTNSQQQVNVVARQEHDRSKLRVCRHHPAADFVDGTTNNIYLGCNPTNLPSDTNIAFTVTAVVSCGATNIVVTHSDTNTECSYTRTYLITVTDTYGNKATTNVIYTWTADTALPVLVGVPAGSNYGCNPSSVPGTISGVTATDTCSPAPVSVTGGAPVTNGCAVTKSSRSRRPTVAATRPRLT